MGRLAFLLGLASLWLSGCNKDVDFAGPAAGTSNAQPKSLIQEFPAATLEDLTLSLSPDRGTANQVIFLRDHPQATKSVKQMDRAQYANTFTQGHDGAAAGPETFNVSAAGLLDLLVVVDYSTSMSDEQTKLAAGFASLISKIDNTDWRIAVAAMGADNINQVDGCLRMNRIIKKTDADRQAAFQAAVTIPLSDSNIEYGFPTAIKALKGECMGVTTPWLRPGSAVGVFILSDEENCGSPSGPNGCPGAQGETAQQMADYLASIRPGGQGRVYGLFEIGTECPSAQTAAIYGQAVTLTQGTAGSICAATYDAALQAISDDVNRIVKREFTLAHAPDASSLNLTIDGTPVTTGFTVSGKKVTFTTIDTNAATLSASYVYGATPKYSRFTLSQAADASTLAVKIGTAVVDPAAYSYDDATKELVFVDEPEDDAAISASYRADVDLPTTVATEIDDMLGAPEKVTVAGNEVPAAGYIYDPATGQLEFPDPPGDGADVAVTYTTTGGVVTSYAAALENDAEVIEVKATDAQTAEEVAVKLVGGQVVFAEEDVVQDREIDLFYQLGYDPDDLTLVLAHEPSGTVSVQASGANPAACDGVLDGNKVLVDCGGLEVESVEISYKAVTERFHTFTMSKPVPAGSTWHIFVDGVELSGFSVDGSTVKVDPSQIPAESIVKVVVDLPPET